MASKRGNTLKTIGIMLEALAIPIFIVNIMLLNTPNPDLRTSGILIIVSNCLFIPGLFFIFLGRTKKNKEEKRK